MKTAEDVQEFERLEQQLHSLLSELSGLSSKKPNDGINKFKLKMINSLLERANHILDNQRPFPEFTLFDDNDLPTNSDTVVMLSQYAAAILLFREDNTTQESAYWYWVLNDKRSNMKTESPSHYKFRG